MRKPTLVQFLAVYASIWISGMFIVGVTASNVVIICINLIGTVIAAATGWAPWRDPDPEPFERAEFQHLQSQIEHKPEQQIVADSSSWTGR